MTVTDIQIMMDQIRCHFKTKNDENPELFQDFKDYQDDPEEEIKPGEENPELFQG